MDRDYLEDNAPSPTNQRTRWLFEDMSYLWEVLHAQDREDWKPESRKYNWIEMPGRKEPWEM